MKNTEKTIIIDDDIRKLGDVKKVLSISEKNKKLGKNFPSVSTLSGNAENLISTKDGKLLTKVPGTCGDACDDCFKYCYARRYTVFYDGTLKAYERNTLLLRNDENRYFEFVRKYINHKRKITRFRWNVSGEIENKNQLMNMVKIAMEYPNIQFGVYTKKYLLIFLYLVEFKAFPDNFIVNISVWKNLDAVKALFKAKLNKINLFVYDDGNPGGDVNDDTPKLRHCPAVDSRGNETGVTCSQCMLCYLKAGHATAVYSH